MKKRYHFILIFLLVSTLAKAQKIVLTNQENINTPQNEFSPTSWGNLLIYVSNRSDQDHVYYDLKFSSVNGQGEMLRSAYLPEMINSSFHEGPSCYHEESNTLYFTRTHLSAGKLKLDKAKKGNLKIYSSVFVDGTWSKPKLLSINKEGINTCHPTVSKDGQTMIYASDEKTSDQKMDLWIVEKDGNEWLNPQRLDSTINQNGNQWFPFLIGDKLVYSSDHALDDNGLDLYSTQIKDGETRQIQRMEEPFNSASDDFGFYINEDENKGYLSSNRKGGMGADDIYLFESENSIFEYSAKAKEVIKEEKENITKISHEVPINQSSNTKKPEKEVAVSIPTKPRVDLKPPSNISTQMGAVNIFENTYFNRDSDAIQANATKELNGLIDHMLHNPNLKVQLSAHTDSRGSESYNQDLSDKRAQTVKNYLVSNGISASRIIALGFGESRLRNHCSDEINCSEEQHRYNRRLEIKIVDN